jgi:hypothetical protein
VHRYSLKPQRTPRTSLPRVDTNVKEDVSFADLRFSSPIPRFADSRFKLSLRSGKTSSAIFHAKILANAQAQIEGYKPIEL